MEEISRTVPFRNYMAPGKNLIKQTATDLEFTNNYSYNLVKDIANYLSHPKESRNEALVKPSSWEFNLPTESYPTRKKREAEERRRIEYHKNVQDFIKNMDFSKVQGDTPVEQALNTVATLSGNKKGKPKSGNTKGGDEAKAGESAEGEGEGEMPCFDPNSGASGESVAKECLETLEMIDKIQPNSFEDKVFGGGKGVLNGVRASKLTNEHKRLLDKIAVFDAHGKIKAEKRKTQEEDEQSKVKRQLNITRFSEVGRVSPINFVLPTFNYKMATKELQRDKGIRIDEAKQCLILLIDDSGSMCSTQKISWIKALLLNRCSEVDKGNAELYICCFETQLSKEWIVVRTPEEAKDVWDNFRSYFRLDGGGTDIQYSVEQAIEIIKSGTVPTAKGDVDITGIRPQICVINDGQDCVERGWIPSIETHGFILEGRHEEMKKFCTRSGGSYKEFITDEQ